MYLNIKNEICYIFNLNAYIFGSYDFYQPPFSGHGTSGEINRSRKI